MSPEQIVDHANHLLHDESDDYITHFVSYEPIMGPYRRNVYILWIHNAKLNIDIELCGSDFMGFKYFWGLVYGLHRIVRKSWKEVS